MQRVCRGELSRWTRRRTADTRRLTLPFVPSPSRTQAQRARKPRVCSGPQGLLPRYSESQADGQEQLFKLTDNAQDEA